MRELHYVKQATDGAHLMLESSDGDEQFLLGIDVALRDAVRSTVMRRVGPGAESRMGPREIQVRVRSGESPQELADSSQTSLEWIMRFATAVLAERTRIADEARRAKARRNNGSGPSVVFGEAIDARFAADGLDASTIDWDAHRREDGHWIVTARWSADDREHLAEWSFQLAARTVTPVDDTAADLLSDRPIRPAAVQLAAPEPLSLAEAPRLALGVVAFPDLAEAQTGPLPVVEDELFDQSAYVAAPGSEGAAPDEAAAAEAQAAPVQITEKKPRRTNRRSPRVTNLGVAGRDSDSRNARPEVPSWDDILLGVRRKQD